MNTLEYKKSISMDDAFEVDKAIFLAIRSYRLQALNRIAIETVVDRLNLEPFLEFLTSFNSGNNLPYHNFYHSICVFLNAYEGAYHEKLDDDETRGLCAGAMLHDFDHSGGHLPDVENIKKALQGLKFAQIYAEHKLLGLSPRSLEVAEAVIKITQYPYERESTTTPERIMRDADLMQPYEEIPAELLRQYLGLKAEMEIQRKTTYTRGDFAIGVKDFQDKCTWYTGWAHEKAIARNWEMVKSDLAKLLSIAEQ